MVGMIAEGEIEKHADIFFGIFRIGRRKRPAQRIRPRKVEKGVFIVGERTRIVHPLDRFGRERRIRAAPSARRETTKSQRRSHTQRRRTFPEMLHFSSS